MAKRAGNKKPKRISKPRANKRPLRKASRRTHASALEALGLPSVEAQLAFSRIALDDWEGILEWVLDELVDYGYLTKEPQYVITCGRPMLASIAYAGKANEVLKHLISDGVLSTRMAYRVNYVAHTKWCQFVEELGGDIGLAMAEN